MPVLSTYHVFDGENGYYFVSSEFNAIFWLDIQKDKIEFLESIPNEMFWQRNLVSKMIRYKNKIIFIPLNAKCIWIKNIESGNWTNVDLKDGETFKLKFFQAIQCKHKIYMIGCRYPAIVCLDTVRESVTYYDEIMKRIDVDGDRAEDVYFRNQYVQIGSYIYMASCKSNNVLKFNMENEQFDLIKVGDRGWRYSGIAWDGHRFWLSPRYGGLTVLWNGENSGDRFDVFDFHIDNEKDLMNGIVYNDQHIYLFAGKSTFFVDPKKLNKIERKDEGCWSYSCLDQTVWISDNGVLKICKNGKENICALLQIDKEDLKKICILHETPYKMHNIRIERNSFNLALYLMMIENNGYKKTETEQKGIGTEIWRYMQDIIWTIKN